MTETIAATGIGALVLRTKPHGVPVGYCAIVIGRGSLAEPEIAYDVLPWAQGNGFATEGAEALLGAAFETGRSRIWSTIRSRNTASLRVADKLGFRQHHSTQDADGIVLWLVKDSEPA